MALITVAERVKALRDGAHYGVKTVRFGVDFAAVSGYVRDVVEAVAPNVMREHIAGLGVRVITGEARFTAPDTVVVGETTIMARRFVVATGSSPILPAVPGFAEIPYLTSKTACSLVDCPRHLIVIGAGSNGLELAQAFRRLGSDVTVLEAATPLASDDPECAAVVLDALAREGVKLRTGVEIKQVRRVLARVQLDIATKDGTETIEGTHLLVAAGRRPNIANLDLAAARIRCEPRGIVVDKSLRTTNKRVYAVGHVAGGANLGHAAEYEAEVVVRNALFRTPVAVDPMVIPSVTRTDPELAKVGLLEDEGARSGGFHPRIALALSGK